MKRPLFLAVVLAGAFVSVDTGCSAQQIHTADVVIEQALTEAQFACVFAQRLTNPKDLAVACEIIDAGKDLTPQLEAFLNDLIVQRASMNKAGYQFDPEWMGWVKKD